MESSVLDLARRKPLEHNVNHQETLLVSEEQLFSVQLRPVEIAAEGKFLKGRDPVYVKLTNFHHHPDPCPGFYEE